MSNSKVPARSAQRLITPPRTPDDFLPPKPGYNALPDTPSKNKASQLREHVAEIHKLLKRASGDFIEIGRRLTILKDELGHGNFLPLLQAEWNWDERTAQRFMSGYGLSLKYDNLSDLSLPPSGLPLLNAPSTPREVQQRIIKRARTGERFTFVQIKALIADAKEAAKPRPPEPELEPKPEPEPESESEPEPELELDRQTSSAKAGVEEYPTDEQRLNQQQSDGDAGEEPEPESDDPKPPPFEAPIMVAIDALVAAVSGKTARQILEIRDEVMERLWDAMPDDGTIEAYWAEQKEKKRAAAVRRAVATRKRNRERDEVARLGDKEVGAAR